MWERSWGIVVKHSYASAHPSPGHPPLLPLPKMVDLAASSSLTAGVALYTTETCCTIVTPSERCDARAEAGEYRELALNASSELFLMQKRVGTPMSRACTEYAMSSAVVFARENHFLSCLFYFMLHCLQFIKIYLRNKLENNWYLAQSL